MYVYILKKRVIFYKQALLYVGYKKESLKIKYNNSNKKKM